MTSPVLAVLNMKGGVGKTTLAANISREIFAYKAKSILLIDLDPQYNLSQQLILPHPYEKTVASGKTAIRLFEPAPTSDFFEVNTNTNVPPPISDITISLRYLSSLPNKQIHIVAGSFDLTKYSFITDNAKLAHARDFFKRSIAEARKNYDLIVIDMNPSSSFLTLCGLSVATDVLSPVRPDKFSVLGLSLVKRLMDHPQVGGTASLHIVMNGVKRNATMTSTEKDIRAADFFKDRILPQRIYTSGVLAARADYTGFSVDRKVANRTKISSDLRLVGFELCKRMGI